MLFVPTEKLDKLRKVLGEDETSKVLDLFSTIAKGASSDPNKEINQIVNILDMKLSKVKSRFSELTSKTEDPVERLKVLSYVVKSAISEM